MKCEKCDKTMTQLYDVAERETLFVRWECADCSHEHLERRPIEAQVAVGASYPGVPHEARATARAFSLVQMAQRLNPRAS